MAAPRDREMAAQRDSDGDSTLTYPPTLVWALVYERWRCMTGASGQYLMTVGGPKVTFVGVVKFMIFECADENLILRLSLEKERGSDYFFRVSGFYFYFQVLIWSKSLFKFVGNFFDIFEHPCKKNPSRKSRPQKKSQSLAP